MRLVNYALPLERVEAGWYRLPGSGIEIVRVGRTTWHVRWGGRFQTVMGQREWMSLRDTVAALARQRAELVESRQALLHRAGRVIG